MQVIHTVDAFRATRCTLEGKRVGFVPTMGALHAGHASLIERSVAECDVTVVSVYVNPTQFDNADDLANYPATLDSDVALAEKLGASVVFAPGYQEMYPDGYRYRIEEDALSSELCGAHRPGHFTGVLTVVMKLLGIVRPDRAYFGEKDYQQYLLIRDMVRAFFLDVEIVPCRIVREADGLALSSRNVNLDRESRRKAPRIHALIESEASDDVVATTLADEGFDVDYVTTKYGRRFVAARVGAGKHAVRLIDNVPGREAT